MWHLPKQLWSSNTLAADRVSPLDANWEISLHSSEPPQVPVGFRHASLVLFFQPHIAIHSPILAWSCCSHAGLFFFYDVFFSLLQLCPVLGLCSCSSSAQKTPTGPRAFSPPVSAALVLSALWLAPSESLSGCADPPRIHLCVHPRHPFTEAVIRLSFTDSCNLIL